MNPEELKLIAATIIQQLGGNKIKAMVNARNFVVLKGDDITGGVSFWFSGSRKANICTILLNHSDTYTMQLWRHSAKRATKKVFDRSDLYNDQIKDVFERETGLYLSL